MPQIKEYLSRSNVPGPIAAPGRKADPADMNLGAGLRALGAGIQDASEALYKRREQKETLDVAAKLAEENATLSNEWRENLRTADPNDDQLSSRFMEKFDDRMTQLGENLSTRGARDYYQRNLSNMRAGFVETTFAGQAEMASVQAKVNYRSVQNSLSSSVLEQPDQFGTALAMHNDALDTLVKQGLSTKAAMELKAEGSETIARNAVMGWIKLNPEQTRARLKSGEWDAYLPGKTKEALYGEVDQEIRARDVQQKKLLADQEKAVAAAQAQTQDSFITKLEKGTLTPKEILSSNLDPVGPGSKEHFLDRLNKEITGPVKTNAAVRNALYKRIHLEDGAPGKITSERDIDYYANDLSNADIKFLRNEVRGAGTEEGRRENALKSQVMKVATDRLTKGVGIKDPKGQEQFLMFQQVYYEEFDKGRKAGKSVQELTSPDFINPILQRFERSPQEKIQDRISAYSRAKSATVPDEKKRKPGESAADYIKRMGQ